MNPVFTMEEIRPMRDGYTISRDMRLGTRTRVTCFSLGRGTSITPESYDRWAAYLIHAGSGAFVQGPDASPVAVSPGDLLVIPPGQLCGRETEPGMIYTEIILEETGKEDFFMNAKVKTNEVFQLKDLIDYEEGSISNLDIVRAPGMKYVLMAFDAGTGLTPHRAPGNAIVFALEGKAVIGYEGQDYPIAAGECFRFEKNGLHSVTADGRFKMALLLVVE